MCTLRCIPTPMLNPLRRSPSLARRLHVPSPPLNQQQKSKKRLENEQSTQPKAQVSARKKKTNEGKDTIEFRHGAPSSPSICSISG